MDKLRRKIRTLIIEEKIKGGLSSGMSIADIAKKHKIDASVIEKQIKKGIPVELEHTGDDEELAKEIAMDHLVEDPNYYDKLEKLQLEFIKKQGEDWVVTSKKGKKLGAHKTRKNAISQLQAIEINKKKQ